MCRRAKTLLQGRNRQAQRQLLGLRPARHKLLLLRIPGRSPSLALASTRCAHHVVPTSKRQRRKRELGPSSLVSQCRDSCIWPSSSLTRGSSPRLPKRCSAGPCRTGFGQAAAVRQPTEQQQDAIDVEYETGIDTGESSFQFPARAWWRNSTQEHRACSKPQQNPGERSSKQALGHKPLEWQPHKPAKPDKCSESRGSRYEGGNGRSPTAQPISLR